MKKKFLYEEEKKTLFSFQLIELLFAIDFQIQSQIYLNSHCNCNLTCGLCLPLHLASLWGLNSFNKITLKIASVYKVKPSLKQTNKSPFSLTHTQTHTWYNWPNIKCSTYPYIVFVPTINILLKEWDLSVHPLNGNLAQSWV